MTTIRKNIAGGILIDVLMSALLVALIIAPTVSILITAQKTSAQVELNLKALAVAQSYLEELLVMGPEAWTSQPFRPLSNHPDLELATQVNLLPARLYEIHVFIRRGDVSDGKTWELATMATASQ